ncbi:MAG: GNAT family N-acetyltransferase [Christensenellales bacterium]|jgi:mycothiol synthase
MSETRVWMLRENLDSLPEVILPEGYRIASPEETTAPGYETLCRGIFSPDFTFADNIAGRKGYWPGAETVLLRADGGTAAVATALCGYPAPRTGYLHYVASDPADRGRGLGYTVSLICLHKMCGRGMTSCRLETDTFRLPAIITYLRLGFRPYIVVPEEEARWREVSKQIRLP